MKKIYIIQTALILTLVIGCNKEVNLQQELKTLSPSNIDADAGTWTPILLTSVNQVVVAPPTSETSDAYKAELQTIKDLQAGLTNAQKESIAYWSAGGVLRWNEILRGLVAKYALAPAPLANGTYPAPDAENPFGDPAFPFANPPYAARAYAYVAAAQYDALKAAWFYKYQFNRKSPYNADSGIEALMTKTDLPGYPSEDAVMSGVSAEVLKLMFPGALEEITTRAIEQRNAALWSGKAAASDISAGLALGKAIAVVFTDRAKTDGAGTAGGNKTHWKMLEDSAVAKGEIPWKSLEVPPRPPQLPLYGLRSLNGVNVGAKAWMMTNAQIIASRPPKPAPTASGEMSKEVEEVKYYSSHLTRERLAIVHKWADGPGTYTPPGHWDEIASHYIEASNFSEVRAARTYALLNMAMQDAAIACWETKYHYFNPRPTQMDPTIKTGTGIPNFPSYTSGHSTFSAAAATVLSYIFPADANYFNEQATEASLSRLYGAIHFRSDCQMGLEHGRVVAGYTVTFAGNDGADD